ncbi:MAG: POTRA domain-containing protein [Bacteroidales bacterium]|nr:hypothetical protein [Bacteroidales bacterium]MDD2425590.1 POTRA domain-containing protein [Bacteroidales bacterium]MDD3988863.1 POTRA domain-containing protein [Bacteroidales bacterium]
MKRSLLPLIIFLLTGSFWNPLFSQDNTCISTIYLTGHRTTKDHVILRELPFKQGDSIKVQNLEKILTEAKNNLINLSLFNFVYVNPLPDPVDPHSTCIRITLEERWFVWPLFSLVFEERNLSSWLDRWDFGRISVEGGLSAYNIWGLNHKMALSYKFGFRRGFKFIYDNIAPGPGGKHILGLEVNIQNLGTENYSTLNNKPLYGSTFSDILKRKEFKAKYYYRPTLRRTHLLSITYEYCRISDSLLLFNREYWGGEDTLRKGFLIDYSYTSDQRDNYQYPLRGYMLNGELKGYKGINNYVSYAQITGRAQYFLPLGKRWYLATALTAGISATNTQGYIYNRAIGYKYASMRGYEYYVIDGQHYFVFNPTLRYQILPTKIINLHLFPFLKKFNKMHLTIYGKSYFDTGYAYHPNPAPGNTLANNFIYSGGLGIDLVTYYDINLSLDYSFNQLGDSGFFFSIKSLIF